MNLKLKLFLLMLFLICGTKQVFAVPAPCSEQELFEASDYAIQGIVGDIHCDSPFDSNECKEMPSDIIRLSKKDPEEFKPKLLAKCIADVLVTRNLKGKYKIGDIIKIPFYKVVQSSNSSNCIIPGRPTKNFKKYAEIEYYNVDASCKYWNFKELSEPSDTNKKIFKEKRARSTNETIIISSILLIIIGFIAFMIFKRRKTYNQK